MLHSRRKAEIEILSTVRTEQTHLTRDSPDDEQGRDITDSLVSKGGHPPLLDYLITKISTCVADYSSKHSQHPPS